jgi:hypothetical protein
LTPARGDAGRQTARLSSSTRRCDREALEQVKLPARVFRMAPRGRAGETLKRALQKVEPWMLASLEL